MQAVARFNIAVSHIIVFLLYRPYAESYQITIKYLSVRGLSHQRSGPAERSIQRISIESMCEAIPALSNQADRPKVRFKVRFMDYLV